ncbi:MAG: hypothetical protein HY954_06300 [Deltaproteobacteria bacterium]|nr:hypothetical protein [Deltaproteobacteria bacterium]
MIEKMRKIQIIGPKAYIDECVKVLHAAAVVHIETVRAGSAEEDFLTRLPIEREKLKERTMLDKASERLKNLVVLLRAPEPYRAVRVGSDEIVKLLSQIAPVEERVKELHAEKGELSEELSTINKYERLLKGFAPIVSRLGGLKNFDIIGLTIEKTREDIAKILDAEINRITEGAYQIYVRDLDESTIGIVVTYPRDFESRIRYLLTGKAINEVKLPEEYADMSLITALKQMGRRKAELPASIRIIERDLDDMSFRWHETLAGLLQAVEDAIDEIGVLSYAAQTKFTFVIEGWVPDDRFAQLKGKFTSMFGDKVVIRELEIAEREVDLIPVYIKNPGFLKPFEVFLSALPAPKYGTTDPTIYIALFFPSFYGLIVGDVGYGAIILILSLILRKKFESREALKNIFTVLAVSSIPAIIFGVLFGELFGDLGERLGIMHPILLNRIEALKTLIMVTMGIGIGHVLLGILIGAVNNMHRGKTKEAFGRIAYFVLICSFLAILGMMFGYLPDRFFTAGAVVLIISLIILTVIEGVLGPLEFIKALGNIVSYVRLMAVGTASVVMAIVANKIGGGSKNLVLGIIIAGLIHSLNLLLSILSPSIQSMRLQYVEFFSKFYEGGGRKYTPFKKR